MAAPDYWFKFRSSPEEIRHIGKLAKRRGMDMSAYVRWLIDQDEKTQAALPKQAGFGFLEETPTKKVWSYE
ncbi:MAG: hypothetical protein HS126_18810 [Anaerolineales bacterium]|nr:hypothetical protein [Anaerolineales bacterium]